MRKRRLLPLAPLALSALLGAWLAAQPAAAQEPPADPALAPPAGPRDPAAAAALFQQGREAVKAGDHAAACVKFAESYRLDPAAVGTVLNLAACSERLGRLAAAWQFYGQALEQLPKTDSRRKVAEERLSALAPRVPRLTVTLAEGAPEGTKVLRDEIELGSASLGTALPVDPGEHAVVVRAPGREDRRYAVTIVEGQPHSLAVEPGPALPEAPPSAEGAPAPGPQPAPEAPRAAGGLGAMRLAGIVVGGVGVVSLGVAITTGLLLPGKQRAVDEHCGADHLCDAEGFEAAQSGQTLATVNTITWIAGGVAVGVGATLFLLGGPGHDDAPSAALTVRPLPGGAGASLRARF